MKKDMSMISQEQFAVMMRSVVAKQFPTALLAYNEEQADAVIDLYAGKAEEYLRDRPSEHKDDFKFADGTIVGLPIAISMVTIIKITAETYLALQSTAVAKNNKINTHGTEEVSVSASGDILRNELKRRLSGYVSLEKTTAIIEQVVSFMPPKDETID